MATKTEQKSKGPGAAGIFGLVGLIGLGAFFLVKGRSAAAQGTISFISYPTGATVVLDGTQVGITPIVITDVPPGVHNVLMSSSGYQDWTATVTVVANKTATVTADLAAGSLTLTDDEMNIFQGWGGFGQAWNANSQTFTPTMSYSIRQLGLVLCQESVTARGNIAIGIENLQGATLWQTSLWSQDLPSDKTKVVWQYIDINSLPVIAGTTYRIVIHCLPTWEIFNGSSWVASDSYQAIAFGIGLSSYPGGQGYYGFDYTAASSHWLPGSPTMCFELYR